MDFVCTSVRFGFFDGNKRYTVEYSLGKRTWYVFNEQETSECLAKYPLNKWQANISAAAAEYYLNIYLASTKEPVSE